ncbi:hypothetical protein CEXT_668881 [Caerostris extrusa]|uniref:Uncharacterized protein n=1 Tax=Caerostris extrusa TaxID=172846 RepID=A0AAV4MRL1_CAEEX|nr:hypothetical protein CEXT_668881 [Caerostris extrusa]
MNVEDGGQSQYLCKGNKRLTNMPMWEIFSHVGGLVGCWLGISVWTAINLFEDLYKSTVKLAFKMRNRSKLLASTFISPMLPQV